MPKYVYTGQDNTPPLIPAGDYVVEVTSWESDTSKKGDEQIKLQCTVSDKPSRIFETLTLSKESFWKVDTCVKSLGLASKINEEVDLCPENMIGRRGWANVIQETYKGKPSSPGGTDGKERTSNKIGIWLTDRAAVERNQQRLMDWIASQANAKKAKESTPEKPTEEDCPF